MMGQKGFPYKEPLDWDLKYVIKAGEGTVPGRENIMYKTEEASV